MRYTMIQNPYINTNAMSLQHGLQIYIEYTVPRQQHKRVGTHELQLMQSTQSIAGTVSIRY